MSNIDKLIDAWNDFRLSRTPTTVMADKVRTLIDSVDREIATLQSLRAERRADFAAMAMQGLVARNFSGCDLAKYAVRQADALIAELAKGAAS